LVKLLEPLKRLFSPRKSEEAERFLAQIFPAGGIPPRRGSRELLREYKNLPWLLACTNKISKSISAVPWELYVTRKEGKAEKITKLQRASTDMRKTMIRDLATKGVEIEEITDHPLLDLLSDCNSAMPGMFVRQITQLWLDLVGEAFWLKERNGLNVPEEIWPLPPTWVTKTPVPGDPFFEISFGVTKHKVPETEVVWFREPDPENPWGRGVGHGHSLADELDTDDYAAQHVKAWFYNRARPDLVIMPDEGTLRREDTARLEQGWLEKSQGFWRSFKPFFMNRRVSIKEISQSFSDMELVKLREFERNTIINVFGVPPEILGILEHSNRATIEVSDFILAKRVLLPRLELMREVIQLALVPDYDDRLIVGFPSPVEEDREFQLNAAKSSPWALTVDEWREFSGKPELPDGRGQVHMKPFNLEPVSLNEKTAPAEVRSKSERRPMLTEEQQIARWDTAVKQWDRFEGKWIRALKKIFQAQQDEVNENLQALEKDVTENLLFNLDEQGRLLDAATKPLLFEVLEVGAREAEILLGLKPSFEVTNPRAIEWVTQRAGTMIRGINETTLGKLRATLGEGMQAGEGIPQLRDRVSEVFTEAKGPRAEMIARTETINAHNEGNLQVFETANVEWVQFWTALDERVCEECFALHGQWYKTRESHGVITVHPSCRCSFIPAE